MTIKGSPNGEIELLTGPLKVHEFMVLTAGGIPLFHYSLDETRKLDGLLSGFLSAISSFAAEFGERSVQSLSFEGSEILYQTEADVLFIFLVGSGAPKRVLRAVLRDLSRRFLMIYQQEMKAEILIEDSFKGFMQEVKRSFAFYEGVLAVTSSLSSFVVPKLNQDAFDTASKSLGLLDEFHRDFGSGGNKILEAMDGKSSIHSMSQMLGLETEQIAEVVEYLVIWGVVRISKMCPVIQETNARFDIYLDLVGLPKRDNQILNRARPLCNGERSVVEISEKIGVTAEKLHDVFTKLGNAVSWKLVEVTALGHASIP
jgi:hypothetical protein